MLQYNVSTQAVSRDNSLDTHLDCYSAIVRYSTGEGEYTTERSSLDVCGPWVFVGQTETSFKSII